MAADQAESAELDDVLDRLEIWHRARDASDDERSRRSESRSSSEN